MPTVRGLDHDDVEGVFHLLKEMRELMTGHVGVGEAFKVSPFKVVAQLTRILGRIYRAEPDVFAQVIEDDERQRLLGVILAERLPDLWSDAHVAIEHVIYVNADARNTISSGRLMLNYKGWCESQPNTIIRAHAEAGPTNDLACKAFEKLGWSERGTIYGKEMR